MGWFLPPLPMSPGNPLVPHHSLSMQLYFSLLGKPGLLLPTWEEGREALQPPDPPRSVVCEEPGPTTGGAAGETKTNPHAIPGLWKNLFFTKLVLGAKKAGF